MGENLVLSEDIKGFSAKILAWKEKYSNIYYQKIGTHEYIFRLLTKSEYLALYFMQFHVSSSAEDILLDKCVLYPENNDWDSLYAGEVGTVVDNILRMSGFSDFDNIKKDLEKERQNIRILDNQIVLIICKAFPHLTPSDINNFDYPTTIHYITLAEELLGTKLEITKPEDQSRIDFNKDNRERGVRGKQIFPARPTPKK